MEILFATDGSEGAMHALDVICDLPLGSETHVTVLSVLVHHSYGFDIASESGLLVAALIEEDKRSATHVAGTAAARLATHGVRATARTADDGTVAVTLMAYLQEHHVDVAVVGSRGLGTVMGTLLGSTARALARHAPVPVLVVRGRREAPRRILAAVDGSPDSDAAVGLLARLPLPADATVTLLHVTPESQRRRTLVEGIEGVIDRAQERTANMVLEAAAKTLEGRHKVGAIVAERGRVAEQVLAQADAMGADLIVLGSRGQTLGRGFLQGSVADRVLGEATCAVLVAKSNVSGTTHEQTAVRTAQPLSL